MEKQWKQWQTLFYWAPKSLQMVNCSHEMKSCLLLGRKAMTNVDSILKSRDITLLTKVHLVKAMVFPVVMYGCEELYYKESWAPKNWCFWSVGLEKTLESPLDCRRIHPVDPKVVSSVLNVHWKDRCLELQYFSHLMGRTDSLEKITMLGKIDGGRRIGQERMRWLHDITNSMDMILSKARSWWRTGRPDVK